MAAWRARAAHVVWLLCVACALLLALGTLLVSLQAATGNAVVDGLLRAADVVDLGVFSREDGLVQVRGEGADVKNALANWGLAAVVWLVVGRVLDRVVRP